MRAGGRTGSGATAGNVGRGDGWRQGNAAKKIIERKRIMEKTNNKKRYGVLAVLLMLMLAAGVGTWAWLSDRKSVV